MPAPPQPAELVGGGVKAGKTLARSINLHYGTKTTHGRTVKDVYDAYTEDHRGSTQVANRLEDKHERDAYVLDGTGAYGGSEFDNFHKLRGDNI